MSGVPSDPDANTSTEAKESSETEPYTMTSNKEHSGFTLRRHEVMVDCNQSAAGISRKT